MGNWTVETAIREIIFDDFENAPGLKESVIVELATSYLESFRPEVLKRTYTHDDVAALKQSILEEKNLWHQVNGLIAEVDAIDAQRVEMGWRINPEYDIGCEVTTVKIPNVDLASAAALHYINLAWAKSPTLEVWIARILTFAEVDATVRQLGSRLKPSKLDMVIAIALYLIAVVSCLNIGERFGPGAGITSFAIWLGLFRFKEYVITSARSKVSETVASLKTAYKMLLRNPPSPAEVEHALRYAEQVGAVWPHGLWFIVEKALARSRVRWLDQ